MKSNKWEKFEDAKQFFEDKMKELENDVKKLECSVPTLKSILQEHPIVHNRALEKADADKIRLILVADNPGEEERVHKGYLVKTGMAGKLARNFFNTPSPYTENLGIYNFEENVIVLNKTPIHSRKTDDLKQLRRQLRDIGGPNVNILEKSQVDMAEILFKFHEALNKPIWIVGYGEMKGIFKTYTGELINPEREKMCEQIYIYHHFSNNRFIRDMNDNEVCNVEELKQLGKDHRNEILGATKR